MMRRFKLTNLFFVFSLIFLPTKAFADINGLIKRNDPPAFNKRLKASVKKLEQRLG